MMNKFYMLTGVPGSGKSTLAHEILIPKHTDGEALCYYASTDQYIEDKAHSLGLTYSEAFKDLIKEATSYVISCVKENLRHGMDIVWDQTNLTKKSRHDKLMLVPECYTKSSVLVLMPTKQELWKRLNNRPGKEIPENVIQNMIKSFQPPSLDEGFSELWIYDGNLLTK